MVAIVLISGLGYHPYGQQHVQVDDRPKLVFGFCFKFLPVTVEPMTVIFIIILFFENSQNVYLQTIKVTLMSYEI